MSTDFRVRGPEEVKRSGFDATGTTLVATMSFEVQVFSFATQRRPRERNVEH
jgi:hypothetical protein